MYWIWNTINMDIYKTFPIVNFFSELIEKKFIVKNCLIYYCQWNCFLNVGPFWKLNFKLKKFIYYCQIPIFIFIISILMIRYLVYRYLQCFINLIITAFIIMLLITMVMCRVVTSVYVLHLSLIFTFPWA